MLPLTLIFLTVAMFMTLHIGAKVLAMVDGGSGEPIWAVEVIACLIAWGLTLYFYFTP